MHRLEVHHEAMMGRDGSGRRDCPGGAADGPSCARLREFAVALSCVLLARAAAARIIISEIHYHPAGTQVEAEALEYVELMNDEPLAFDVSGYRLAGGIDYTFPPTTVIDGGAAIVVGSEPEALRAIYGVTAPLGPFSRRLGNGGDEVLLVDPGGSTVCRVAYNDRGKWPAAADGAGPSLVLRHPLLDPDEGESWGWSPGIGGTPGVVSHEVATSEVVLNELGRSGGVRFVEIFNPGTEEARLAGYLLSSSAAAAGAYRFGAATIVPPGGLLSLVQSELGFPLEPPEQLLVLFAEEGGRVVDARHLEEALDEGSDGRFPDGGARWFRLAAASPGEANRLPEPLPLVISEIHYHPYSGSDAEEFVEITNIGTDPVALSGCAFTNGIRFAFPSSTTLAPGEYLVVARDPAVIEVAYGITAVLGPYEGRLSDRGEMLRLVDARGNPVDEVRYYDEGSWPRWPDGDGPSLELRDLRQDNSVGAAWQESDHAATSEWVEYEYSARQGSGDSELHLFLMGAGEALLDDIEVVPAAGGDNLIPDGRFDGPDPLAAWRIEGTHVDSHLEVNGGPDGTSALRVVATKRGDTRVNRIERQTSPSLRPGAEYTVRFKARWLRGADGIMTRSWNHGLARVHRLAVPRFGGTPGRPNSRAVARSGPLVTAVEQSPVLPPAATPVTIRARVTDPDGVESVRLYYRMDGAREFIERPMLDDGVTPDGRAGDGTYAGEIEAMGRRSGVAEFYIEARDRDGLSRTEPAGSPEATFLYQYDDGIRAHAVPAYRIVLRGVEFDTLRRRSPHSNYLLAGSLIYRDERIFHQAGVRYRGSPFLRRNSITGNRKGFRVRLRDEAPLAGAVRIVLDEQAADATRQVDRLVRHFIQKAGGIPYGERRYVHVLVRGSDHGTYEQVLAVDRRYLERAFGPDGASGELYKIDAHYELNDQGEFAFPSFKSWAFTNDEEELRFTYKKRSHEKEDDFSQLMELLRLMDLRQTSDSDFDARAHELLDLDAWVKGVAVYRAVEDWDTIGGWTGKNVYLYRHADGRWRFIPWDHDVSFGQAALRADQNARAYLYTPYFPEMRRLLTRPVLDRRFNAELLRLMEEDYTRGAVDPVLDRTYELLRATSGQAVAPSGIKSFLATRRAFILSRIADPPLFTIETNGGAPFSTEEDSVILSGKAPYAVASVVAARSTSEARWRDKETWELELALRPGVNELELFAVDSRGEVTAAQTIAVSFEGAAIPFTRGDTNGDGRIQLADAIAALRFLFGGLALDCEDAADVDDSGRVGLADAIFLLDFLFTAGSEPPRPPYPEPGVDPTPDGLTCR